MTLKRIALPLCLLTSLASCGDEQQDQLDVSVIGNQLAMDDPATQPIDPARAVILAATAQGLVRFDATAQVQPGLASRWAIVDQGRSLIFRLTDGNNEGRRPDWLSTRAIAERLRRTLINNPINPLSPQFNAVESIRAVTPQVIEIRLTSARPELLTALAQPEAALLFGRQKLGTGPLKVINKAEQGWTLTPVDIDGKPLAAIDGKKLTRVMVRAEKAPLAVARFARGWTQLVLNGQLKDLPLVAAAKINDRQLQVDPTNGLFGLAIGNRQEFLKEPAIRRVLAMALDRPALLHAFDLAQDMSQETLLPPRLTDLADAPESAWMSMPQDAREAFAREQLAQWTKAGNDIPILRLALPAGHGSDLLFRHLRAQWARIGIPIERGNLADADLWLIDMVAPADTASWYLRQFMCVPGRICDHFADRKLIEAKDAPTPEQRMGALREASSSYNDTTPFIPLFRPIRWSLVAPSLDGFTPNGRAVHPIDLIRFGRSRP